MHASAQHWSPGEIGRFEKAVLKYTPQVPVHLKDPEQRRTFAKVVRATRKDLLQAVGIDRLAPKNRDLVATEQRALGDRFDRTIGEVKGGTIGPPMEAGAMAKAKDRDILKIFVKFQIALIGIIRSIGCVAVISNFLVLLLNSHDLILRVQFVSWNNLSRIT